MRTTRGFLLCLLAVALLAGILLCAGPGRYPDPVQAAVTTVKDIQLLTYDYSTATWRKIVKGELSGVPAIVSKATDYTVPATALSGTVYIATGDVDFTLPAPTNLTGVTFTFISKSDNPILVKTATADTLIVNGDLTADSVTFSTADHKVGAKVVLFCDGTSWYAFNASDCTMTIAT